MLRFQEIIKFIALMIVCVIIASILSVFLFYIPFFDVIDVFMYKGIFIIFITAIILFIVLLLLMKIFKNLYNVKDIICIVIVFICVNVTFFTLVPVTVERSISVFTLSQIEEIQDDTITIEDAERVFNDKYIKENEAFKKRFYEQIVTGSLKENVDNSYTLTNLGHFLVKMFRNIGKLYKADCKNLY